jgi:hypothetical protein
MQLELEVWLRGRDDAATDVVEVAIGPPAAWTDHDVRLLLGALLRAIDRAKHPDAALDRPVFLRGFNWIVNPFEGRGVLVSVEIQSGAAAAGPFQVDQAQLEAMITRVVAEDRARPPGASEAPPVH